MELSVRELYRDDVGVDYFWILKRPDGTEWIGSLDDVKPSTTPGALLTMIAEEIVGNECFSPRAGSEEENTEPKESQARS